MPVYEYACPDCRFQFEKIQKFSDKPIKLCPNCKKRNVHKVMPRIAVSFKGSGFYVNDSKGSSNSVSKTENKPDETTDKPTAAVEAAPATETPKTEAPAAATETKADTDKNDTSKPKPEAKKKKTTK